MFNEKNITFVQLVYPVYADLFVYLFDTRYTFFTRDSYASRVFAIVWASVCLSVRPSVRLSVCPSVTLVICIKTVQARIAKSSLCAAPRSLVITFFTDIFCAKICNNDVTVRYRSTVRTLTTL